MLTRAAAAAALSLLVAGDAARVGWAAFGVGRFLFPSFFLFLLVEALRGRRRVEDGEVFLLGSALAVLYAGVYTKFLQNGFLFFGVDWIAIVDALFDGGMIAVLSMHVLDRFRARPAENPEPGIVAHALLAFIAGGAALVYGIRTAFGFYRADRLLGPTWLAADVLFSLLAWRLIKRALERADEEHAPREEWVWVAAAYCVAMPMSRLIARVGFAFDLPAVLVYFFVAVPAAAVAYFARLLWRERLHAPTEPARAVRAAGGAALWRAVGALVLLAVLGKGIEDDKAALYFSVFVDLPSRALFAWAFLTGRLAV